MFIIFLREHEPSSKSMYIFLSSTLNEGDLLMGNKFDDEGVVVEAGLHLDLFVN